MMQIERWVWRVTILVLAAVLLGIAALGWFSRYQADDYCMAWTARDLGLLRMQPFWYETWSGRYATTFFIGLGVLGGQAALVIMPALALLLLSGSLYGLLALIFSGQAVPRADRSDRLIALCLSLLLPALLYALSPNPYQSWHWLSGFASYFIPLPLLVLQAWIVVWAWDQKRLAPTVQPRRSLDRQKAVRLALLAGLALIAAGFAEVAAPVQIALYALALVWLAAFDRSQEILWLLLIGLLMSLVGLALVAVAPGNQAREVALLLEEVAKPEQLWWLWLAARNAFLLGLHYAAVFRWHWLLLVGLGLWLGGRFAGPLVSMRRGLPQAAFLVAAAYGVLLAANGPAAYVMHSSLEERAQVVPVFVLLLLTLGLGWIVGRLLNGMAAGYSGAAEYSGAAVWSRKLTWLPPLSFAVLPLLLGVIWFAVQLLLQIGEQKVIYREYAATWDERQQAIQSAANEGQRELSVPGLTAFYGLQDIRSEPGFWVNLCMAQYYEIDSLSGR